MDELLRLDQPLTPHFCGLRYHICSLEIGPNLCPRANMPGSLLSRLILVQYAAPSNDGEPKALHLISAPSAVYGRPHSPLKYLDARSKPSKLFREYKVRVSPLILMTIIALSPIIFIVFVPSSPLFVRLQDLWRGGMSKSLIKYTSK